MLKKNDIKLIRSLRLKKYRQKYNKFVVEGEKISIEALKSVFEKIEMVFCTKGFYDTNRELLGELTRKSIIVSDKELNQISNFKSANSCLLILKFDKKDDYNILRKSKIIVYLDDITDPGNMGTIIRSCDWFDIDTLVVSLNSVDIYNPKVIQSSMGSIFRLPIIELEFDKVRDILDGFDFTYYGTELEGEKINKIKYNTPLVVVIGNESKGISKEVDEKLDFRITIPRYNESTESLNAAVATSIVLYNLKESINS